MPSRRFACTSLGFALRNTSNVSLAPWERLQLELGIAHQAQSLGFPFESLRFAGQQPQVASLATAPCQLHGFLEIERDRHQDRAVVRLEVRQQLEDRTVPELGVGVQRRAQRRGEPVDGAREVRAVVGEVPVGLQVERVLRPPSTSRAAGTCADGATRDGCRARRTRWRCRSIHRRSRGRP